MIEQLPRRTYVAAGGVVVEPDRDQVLVLLRPERVGPGAEPEIRLPKGHVESDESYGETALREVREESGLSELKILADLGQQTVEFDWQGYHYVREEIYFLMEAASAEQSGPSEAQFQREWLPWDQAQAQLTFDAEQEWVHRAREAWTKLKRTHQA